MDYKDYSQIDALIYGKFFNKTNVIDLDAGYERDMYGYYGYDHEDTTLNLRGESEMKQFFQTISIGAALANKKESETGFGP